MDQNSRPAADNVERITDTLEKPELDDRSYRVIRLSNKLEVLLVHDPDTDKASASVNVNVGSFSDDDDMPGMAHAVEHLLFMGTKKFPVENAYSQYLSAHSGYANAYTASTETNYFFEIAAEGSKDEVGGMSESPLYGALDRFAQFFISPLFLAETLDRELRAVDSENKKNLQSDTWRLMQLDRSTSNPKHPYHHFSTGNLSTLRDEPRKRGVNIREAFMAFHDKHYSADRMKLVVLGKESLDQLEGWASELFSDVKNKNLPPNRWDDAQPMSKEQYLTQIFAKPIMDSRELNISFSYRDETELFASQPSHYISNLIGHEGPGSILAYIKAKGWCNALSSGAQPICPGAAIFMVSIRLTPEGLENYQEIVKIVFQYIAMIKEKPPQEWIVEEMKGLHEVDFRFKEKSPASRFTSSTSSKMQKPYPREWLLSGPTLIRKFDPEAIKKGLDCLTAENYRLTIVSQTFPGNWDQKEKWYGTEYKIEMVPEDLQGQVREAIKSTSNERPKDLHLPHKNEFVPKNVSVEKKEVAEPAKAPTLVRNEPGLRLWWKKDDRFWVPKAAFIISLRTPHASVTPASSTKGHLYCSLVNDALVEYSYDAELAGLDYSFRTHSFGLDIAVSGYNDKLHVLLDKVLTTARTLEIKPDRFKIIKENLLREFRNWEFSQPYAQVQTYGAWLGTERSWVNEHYLAELPAISLEDVQAYYPSLLNEAFIEVLAHGNLYKEDALRMTTLTESILKSRAFPASQWQIRRNTILAPGADFTWRKTLADPANVNNCIEYYLYLGALSDQTLRAKAMLFAQLVEEKAFDQLRTKEQLGYIVWSGTRNAATTIGYHVIVQSERSCAYLEGRINAFLVLAAQHIRDMSADDFDGYRRSIINKRLEKLKNLSAETSRFWSRVMSEFYNFHQVERDVEALRALTKRDITEFYERYIDPASADRAKLAVHIIAQTSPEEVRRGMTEESRGEQKTKVLDLLAKFLTSQGIEADADKLGARYEDVDVSGGDTTAMLAALKHYLASDASVGPERVETITVQLKQMLGTVLPSLGIEVKSELGEGKGEEELLEPPKVRDTVFIDDVAAWKAGLALTAGPQPVEDLSRFMEPASKL